MQGFRKLGAAKPKGLGSNRSQRICTVVDSEPLVVPPKASSIVLFRLITIKEKGLHYLTNCGTDPLCAASSRFGTGRESKAHAL